MEFGVCRCSHEVYLRGPYYLSHQILKTTRRETPFCRNRRIPGQGIRGYVPASFQEHREYGELFPFQDLQQHSGQLLDHRGVVGSLVLYRVKGGLVVEEERNRRALGSQVRI